MSGEGLVDREAGGGRVGPRAAEVAESVILVLTGYACHLYYNLVGHVSSLRGHDLGPLLLTPLDRAIPYMPFWVHFYQIAYFMPGVVIVLLMLRIGSDAPAVRRLVFSFLALLGVHYFLYLAVPTSAHAVRLSESALGEGMLGDLVRYQYHLATPWCAWPSLHVSACWFFYRLLARRYRRLGRVYLAWFVGMFVGTVAIKIHYLADGITGLVLGEIAFRFLFLRLERRGAYGWTWRSNRLRAAVHLSILALLLAGLPLLIETSGFEGPLYTLGAK